MSYYQKLVPALFGQDEKQKTTMLQELETAKEELATHPFGLVSA
jgi:hypothetical protein